MATVTLTGKVLPATGSPAPGVLELKAISGEKTDGTVFANFPTNVAVSGDGSVSLTLEEGMQLDVTFVTSGDNPRRYSLGRWIVPASGVFANPTLFDAWRSSLGGNNGSLLSSNSFGSGLMKTPKRGSSDLWTFTPRMRVCPNGLESSLGFSYIVQGKSDVELYNVGDLLTFGRGSQIAGNHYETFNSNQGTLIAIVQVPWLGSDGKSRYLFGQSDSLMIAKYGAGRSIAVNNIAGTIVEASCNAWAFGSWHSIICRWNAKNPVSETSTSDLWLDGVQTLGDTDTWFVQAPVSLSSIGVFQDKRYPWGGNGIAILVLTDNVISDAECTAIHNGGSFIDPIRALKIPERIVFYLNPALKYTAATALSGSIAGDACNMDQKAYDSGTNPNGNMLVNGDFEVALGAEWVAEGATLTRETDTAGLAGFRDTAYCKVQHTGSGNIYQVVTGFSPGEDVFLTGSIALNDSPGAILRLYSGTSGSPMTTMIAISSTHLSTTPATYQISGIVQPGHDRVCVRVTTNGTAGTSFRIDSLSLRKSMLVNGNFNAGAARTSTLAAYQAGLSTAVDDAFSNSISVYNLNPSRLNHKLIITDSAGKKLTGYIKSIGTGYTESSELVDAFVNNASYPYETFTPGSGNHIDSAINSSAYGSAIKTITAVQGARYSIQATTTQNSGQVPTWYWGTGDGLNSPTNFGTGPANGSRTAVAAHDRFGCWNDAASNFALTYFTLKRVLTVGNNGIRVTDTPGGTSYNWTSMDSGFNLNDPVGYGYSTGLGWTPVGADASQDPTYIFQHLKANVVNGGLISDPVTTEIGKWYVVRAKVKRTAGIGSVGIGLSGHMSLYSCLTTSSSWQEVSFIFQATATSHQISIYGTWTGTEWDTEDVAMFEMDSIDLTATPADETGSKDIDGFRMDGADICSKPTSNDIRVSNGTILIKFKPRGWNGDDARYHYLMDIRTSDTLRLLIFTYKSGSCYAAGAIYDSIGYKAIYAPINAALLPDNTVARIGFRWNGATLKVRCNGIDGSTTGGSGLGYLSGIPTPMYLGCCATSPDNTADSEILAVKTFDRDLTDAELTAELAAL